MELGEDGWLKALRLEEYAPRATRRPMGLQQALFPYHEAWGDDAAPVLDGVRDPGRVPFRRSGL